MKIIKKAQFDQDYEYYITLLTSNNKHSLNETVTEFSNYFCPFQFCMIRVNED